MKKSLILSMCAATAVTFASAAVADETNEQLTKLTKRFEKADANGDGKLTKQEAKEGGMTRVAKFFERLDSDGDGFVTFEQLRARLEQRSR